MFGFGRKYKHFKSVIVMIMIFGFLFTLLQKDIIYAEMPLTPNKILNEKIVALSNTDSTRYSLFAAYPKEDRTPYIYQSEQMRSASMIKVFLLAYAMELIHDGQLSLDMEITLKSTDKVGGAGILCGYASGTNFSLDTILRLMITESDNTATNMVIDLLGKENINNYIQRNGYSDTVLNRKMMDFEAANAGWENYTSVTDLGNIFLKIYNHECVGNDEDEIMLSYLKGQTDTECFPTALPNATIAHKTGELGGLYDDGGIIYMNDRDIVLVIMTEHYSSRYRALEIMKEMAITTAYN